LTSLIAPVSRPQHFRSITQQRGDSRDLREPAFLGPAPDRFHVAKTTKFDLVHLSD